MFRFTTLTTNLLCDIITIVRNTKTYLPTNERNSDNYDVYFPDV